jgi:hypothetical protein
MAGFRRSTARNPNDRIVEGRARPRSLADAVRELAKGESVNGTLLLVGGCDLTHFRLRVAQSHVRADMAPSLWSHVGIVCEDASGVHVFEVALDPEDGFRDMPKTNGVRRARVERYDDHDRFPNLALVRFPTPRTLDAEDASDAANGCPITDAIARLGQERGLLDIPGLVLPWLGFVWGAGHPANPLLSGTGIPSAVFVEAAFAALGVELTPGLSTRSSCPDAIWQSARWWHPFYGDRAPADTSDTHAWPTGVSWIGQSAASYVE